MKNKNKNNKKKGNFKEFKDIIPADIKYKIKKKYLEKQIIDLFNSSLHGTISNHVKAIYVYKNEIYCGVDNPLWGNEIISYKDLYLKKINKNLNTRIKGIKFKLIPNLFNKEEIKKEKEFNLTDNQKEEIEKKLKNVKDEKLKKVMYDLLASKFNDDNINKK